MHTKLIAQKLKCTVPHVIGLIGDGTLIALDMSAAHSARASYRIICESYRRFIVERTGAPLMPACTEGAILRAAAADVCARLGQVLPTAEPGTVLATIVRALEIPPTACCLLEEMTARLGTSMNHLEGLVDTGLLSTIDIKSQDASRRALRVPPEAQDALMHAMLCEEVWRDRLVRKLPPTTAATLRAALNHLAATKNHH